jgi:hypothetical protein
MRDKMLFHVSEQHGIELFEPRWSENAGKKVLWAIDADHLRNYLVPRECPRVTYYAGPQTTTADVERFLGKSQVVGTIPGTNRALSSHSAQVLVRLRRTNRRMGQRGRSNESV